jgi:protein involved in ribonucleotide reduction
MILVYLSLTGNVRSFVEKLDMKATEINYSNPQSEINEEFIFITPSYDNAAITEMVSEFVEYRRNKKFLLGFVGSGNLNFNKDYCFNAKELASKYDKPLIFTFEFSGTDQDIINFKKEVLLFDISRA